MQFDFLNNYSILIVMFFVDIAYTTDYIQQLSQESHTFRQLMLYRPSFFKIFFFFLVESKLYRNAAWKSNTLVDMML